LFARRNSHRFGALLRLQGAILIAFVRFFVCKAHALFRQKACISLFEFTLTHRVRQKRWPIPVSACRRTWRVNSKRAGFPEWQCEGNAAFANLKRQRLRLATSDLKECTPFLSPGGNCQTKNLYPMN